MADYMDWKAAMSSEVFREYAANELQKTAEHVADAENADDNQEHLLNDFAEFEKEVLASPKKLAVFKKLQDKFANDPVYRKSINQKFVDAVMLLNLD